MSTFDLTQKIKVVNPNASNDSQYGPYNSISEALTATQGLRELGRTVGIIESGIITEYWFKEGILDTDLILKESGGGIESVTGDLVDNTDPANPIIETPTLQQITDEGATTTNTITVGGGLNQVDINDDGTINATSNITGGALVIRNTDGELGSILSDNLTDDRDYQLQDKDGTLAHLDDILSDAEDIDYDNTTSGLDAENVQEAVDELNEVKINSSDILDVNDKIKVELLPNSVMELKGQWNAATNTPTLVNGTGNPGDVYEVTVEGSQDFGGSITYNFAVGDFVVYGADDKWYRSPNTYPTKEVISVSSNLTLNPTHNGKTLRFTDILTVTVPAGLGVNFEVFLDNDTVSDNVTFDMSAITTVLAPSGNILVGSGTGYLTMTTATKVSLKGDFID